MNTKYHFTVTFYDDGIGRWFVDAGPIGQPGIWDLAHSETLERAGECLGAGLVGIVDQWKGSGQTTNYSMLMPEEAFLAEYTKDKS